MHIRYGDGERAFELLQKEVLKLPRGMEVLAWDRSDVTRSGSLLATSPDDFAHCSSVASDRGDDSVLKYGKRMSAREARSRSITNRA